MVVKFNKLSASGIALLIVFSLGLMFDLIAFATDNWCTYRSLVDNEQYDIGLWNGCRHGDGRRVCMSRIFDREEFGGGSEWYVGARVLMTLSLVCQLCQLLVLICYICIQQMIPHRSKLTATNIGLTMTIALFNLVTLVLYGAAAKFLPGSKLQWSYGLAVCGFINLLCCGAIVIFMRWRLLKIDRSRRDTPTKAKEFDANNIASSIRRASQVTI